MTDEEREQENAHHEALAKEIRALREELKASKDREGALNKRFEILQRAVNSAEYSLGNVVDSMTPAEVERKVSNARALLSAACDESGIGHYT